MNINKTLADRINESMLSRNINQQELASAVGLSQAAIQKLTSGKALSSRKIVEIAKVLKTNPEWLMSGEFQAGFLDGALEAINSPLNQPLSPPLKPPTSSDNYSLGTFDTWDSNTPLNDDEVALPFYREIELAAGSGRTMIQENNGFKLRFSKSTLSKSNVDAGMAACVTVSGNSMEPVLPDGATIGIDTSKTSVKGGDIYAIDHDGQLRVKMVYRTPAGIRLKSFNNDEWPDENYNAEDSQKIKVLGRVFWWSVLR